MIISRRPTSPIRVKTILGAKVKICWGQYEIICSIENGPYCIIFVYKEYNTIFEQLWRKKKIETLFVVAARGII